jgi:DNA-binding transcriptional ArsR family regulator
MPATNEVPTEIVQQIADYFSVLGEPMRLRILNLLRDGEKCVQDLVEATETSQANVSKHLKVMLQAGILTRRTQGTLAYYGVADDLGFQLCTLVCDRLASRIEQQALYFREFSVAGYVDNDYRQQSHVNNGHAAVLPPIAQPSVSQSSVSFRDQH